MSIEAVSVLEDHGRMTARLVDSLYVEAMLLADESRAYFDRDGREERRLLEPLLRVAFSCESLKVTTRLMHIVSWLLSHRAAQGGEPGFLAASQPRRLGAAIASDDALVGRLPDSARKLVEASEELYARVRRLDEGGAAMAAAPSPARTLLNRLERSL